MSLKIVFENDQLLVVEKPAGIVVNRSETISKNTLQDQLSGYFKLGSSDLGIGGRAGIVHRLDRETSGLLVIAKTQEAFENLQAQFAKREVKKEYLALAHGQVKENKGSITFEIARIGKFGKFGVAKKRDAGGRETRTDYEMIEILKFSEQKFQTLLYSSSKSRINYLKNHAASYTYLKIRPETGRTHQIRVALKHIGHPIVSDTLYAPAKLLKFDMLWCQRLFLHASRILFADPISGKRIEFESGLPNDLSQALASLTIDN